MLGGVSFMQMSSRAAKQLHDDNTIVKPDQGNISPKILDSSLDVFHNPVGVSSTDIQQDKFNFNADNIYNRSYSPENIAPAPKFPNAYR